MERSTNDSNVQICLDLAHLLQLEWNVFERTPVLPIDFPWHRVSEIHLSGNMTVDYLGRSFILNEHDVDIDDSQYALLGNILNMPGLGRTVDVCLEMEPRHPNAVQGAKKRLTAFLDELK